MYNITALICFLCPRLGSIQNLYETVLLWLLVCLDYELDNPTKYFNMSSQTER